MALASESAANSIGMCSRSATLPYAAIATIKTHWQSKRNPMKRFVINHQYQDFAFFSRRSMTTLCISPSRLKARMHVNPLSAVNLSNTGERVTVSQRLNSVMDFTTKRRNQIMYQSIKRKTGTTGGTAMHTTTNAPTAVKPRSATSCMDSASCSSTLLRSPLKRFKMRPSGFEVKKAKGVCKVLWSALEWSEDDALNVAE
mmetsp:Transcript_35565/g.65147  ORF Transcript_35565/g.65147 Transcript_35565/m.65147 type:complete len:200 (+) Transcript_35565:595-1194(+)